MWSGGAGPILDICPAVQTNLRYCKGFHLLPKIKSEESQVWDKPIAILCLSSPPYFPALLISPRVFIRRI